MAAIDLPAKAWPELIPSLLATMADATPPRPAPLRAATLEAIGYVCEEMGRREDDVLEQDAVNAVLTAVVAGMKASGDTPDDGAVRLAATRALFNALEFAATNFESADERNYLMQVGGEARGRGRSGECARVHRPLPFSLPSQVICEATVAREPRAREAAFECLVKVAAAHYEKLPAYMQASRERGGLN